MSPVAHIAWREYKQYIFSRGFLLFMVMFPLGVIFGGAAIGIMESAKPARSFVVFDQTGLYADKIDREIEDDRKRQILAAWDAYAQAEILPGVADADAIPAPFAPAPVTSVRVAAFEAAGGVGAGRKAIDLFLRPDAPAFVEPRKSFLRLSLPAEITAAGSVDEASAMLRPFLLGEEPFRDEAGMRGELFAAVLIPEGFGQGEASTPAQYWSRNLTDGSLQGAVSRALDSALRREAAREFGLAPGVLEKLSDIDAPVTAFRPDRLEGEAELGMQDQIETILPAIMTYMLLVIIFGVGNLLLTNTIEERSNKIVEVLLSSVTADQLMMGKLAGIAAVGLTMPTVFTLGAVIASFAAPNSSELMQAIVPALLSSNLLFVYLFYFLCAYIIFAMIFLAIGAVSNSLQDAQSYMGPVMLLVFAPLPFMFMVYENPNGLIASILTWIPIYTPYAIMMRAASDPPLWEVLGATALMLAFALLLVRVMGRIFRHAILQSAPPRVRDVLRLAGGRGE